MMTDSEIKKLAEKYRQAGGFCWYGMVDYELLDFARAIESATLEKAAVKCDEKIEAEYATGKVDHNEMAWCMSCANAIRAMKGEQE